jgi:hypothetical protein
MPSGRKGRQVRVQYSYVDGVHFFTSAEVKGLCAASKDLRAAFNAVSLQLNALVRDEPGSFEPSVPVEKFEQWFKAHHPDPVPELKSGAIAQWALKKKAQMTTA